VSEGERETETRKESSEEDSTDRLHRSSGQHNASNLLDDVPEVIRRVEKKVL